MTPEQARMTARGVSMYRARGGAWHFDQSFPGRREAAWALVSATGGLGFDPNADEIVAHLETGRAYVRADRTGTAVALFPGTWPATIALGSTMLREILPHAGRATAHVDLAAALGCEEV